MPAAPVHQSFAADVHQVPKPFRHFAVRSDEPRHAWQARAPYGQVHRVQTHFLDTAARAALSAQGWSGITLDAPLEVTHAITTPARLAAAAPLTGGLTGGLASQVAAALQHTGVLGHDLARYQQDTAGRIDYLAGQLSTATGALESAAPSISKLAGKVVTILPEPDRVRRAYTVKVKLDAPIPGLRVGMSAEANVIVQRKDLALLLPAEAVEGAQAWFVVDGRAVKRPVTLGIRDLTRVEVLAGAAERDLAIVDAGARHLTPGARVAVTERAAP